MRLLRSMVLVWVGLFLGCVVAPASAQDPAAPKKPPVSPHSLAAAKARPYPPLPDGVDRKHVTIWSDGTRMAGDLYLPKGIKADQKLPVIVFVNGTGGVKRKLPTRIAPRFVAAGFAFIAFDYRGWGESDSKLQLIEKMPEPDEKGEVTVKARAIRWQMDYPDQTTDIKSVISFVAGEPNVDPELIGLFGTSFGGGLVTWVAGNDTRVKCLVAQVPGMAGKRSPDWVQRQLAMAAKQARGDAEPVPFKTGGPGGKMAARYGHMRYNRPKWVGYSPLDSAHKITAPTLIVDAEEEDLFDIKDNGGKLAEILKAKGVTVKHHVVPGIKHYGVYKLKFDEVMKMEIEWFARHLKVEK